MNKICYGAVYNEYLEHQYYFRVEITQYVRLLKSMALYKVYPSVTYYRKGFHTTPNNKTRHGGNISRRKLKLRLVSH